MTTFKQFMALDEAPSKLKPVPFPCFPLKFNTGHTSPVKPWWPKPDTLAKHCVRISETDITASVAKKLAGLLDTTAAQLTAQQSPASTGGKT